MSVVHTEFNYAESDYAQHEYAATLVAAAQGAQFRAEISAMAVAGAQFESFVVDRPAPLGAQQLAIIEAQAARAAQLRSSIEALVAIGVQFRGQIVDVVSPVGSQADFVTMGAFPFGAQETHTIESAEAVGGQFNSFPGFPSPCAAQFEAHIVSGQAAHGGEFLKNTVFHSWDRHAVYAVDDYATGPYLINGFTAHLNASFKGIINPENPLGGQFLGAIAKIRPKAAQFHSILEKFTAQATQFEGLITPPTPTPDPESPIIPWIAASQVRGEIVKIRPTGAQFSSDIARNVPAASQFSSVQGLAIGMQFRSVLYNTRQLRILWEFPSRGTTATNWTANSTAMGDFNVNNVNTDVVEQVWRSAPGAKTGLRLDCDTGLSQGVFLDTLAILNHNLTKSATITVQGDDDPAFGSPGIVLTLAPVDLKNAYYIAPELPMQGYRYWRISIDDFTNTNNYLEIGTILFGESTIFTEEESFSNPIKFQKYHYTDKIETEGFTTVSNDRGIKKNLALDFQNINFSGGNYANLQEIFENMRTSHKMLWIPTPKYPARYALFGKLTQIPSETHQDLGEGANYVDFTIELDEAK